MDKSVIVSIKGIQTTIDFDGNGEDETMEMITEASYYFRNNKHYIIYEDYDEEYKAATKNTIKISDEKIEIQKSGVISTNMIFENDSKNVSRYTTPFGDMEIEIDTGKIDIEIRDTEIEIRLDYNIAINSLDVSKNRMEICIRQQ